MPRLSDKAIENLPAPKQGQTEVWDSIVPGFGVRVGHGGRRSFVLMYRVHGDSRKRRLTLGPYPALSLADARQLARDALIEARRGVDPAETWKAGPAGGQITYAQLVEEFIAKYRDADRRRSWHAVERMLRKETVSLWGSRPAAAITREDVQSVLEAMQRRGSPITANRVIAALRPMFKWAAATGRVPASPVNRMSNPVSEKGRARDHVIDDADLPKLWRAWDQMGQSFGPMLKLLLLTGQRRGEVAGIRWADLDLEKGVWTLSSDDKGRASP
jgi:Arm DNA-binding domain